MPSLREDYPICHILRLSGEGATSQFVPKNQSEGIEFLVIKFKLGVFMPYLPAGQSFWLNGFAWHLPDFDNAETFVERLVRQDVLVMDPLVRAALQDHPLKVSSRTVRRRCLKKGISILDTVYLAGYADQPHMTRSLRRFFGQTPSQIARMSQPE